MKASIITIGDEILIGQIVDTNSAWMADVLNSVGIQVHEIRSISDEKQQIISSINELFYESDFIFMTGGLGPTNDDITKKVLCEMLDCDLVLNKDALSNVRELLGKRGYEINENNYYQAMVPEKAKVFVNKLGTAPGMMFRIGEKLLFSMPGVPFEMKYLIENKFILYLKKQYKLKSIFHKTILTSGLPEAMLAQKLSVWENSLPEEIKLAYLPSPGYIRLRLSVYNANNYLVNLVEQKVSELKTIIPENFKTDNDLKPDELVADILVKTGLSLATAESCTGGKIASMLTAIPGSSTYFKGSVISYSNEIKINVLGVSPEDLEEFGAVSSQVVEQMAIGARKLLNTDYALSTSGIAGPDGGTPEKPVGTVWIGLASKDKVISKKLQLFKEREFNILGSANAVLMMLINEINKI